MASNDQLDPLDILELHNQPRGTAQCSAVQWGARTQNVPKFPRKVAKLPKKSTLECLIVVHVRLLIL